MTKLKRYVALISLFTVLQQPVFAQTFELSEKALEFSWPSLDWNGQHIFPPVYCLTFPSPGEAVRMTRAMFNRNSISLTRVIYKNGIALFVVTSVIPAGRTPDEDVAKMQETNRLNAEMSQGYIKVQDLKSNFGLTGGLIIRNSSQGGPKTPFPLAREVAIPPDGTLRSLSIHRLFARGPDRFEVAALRFFNGPVSATDEQTEINSLSSVVDSTVEALHKCSSQMPMRNRN